MSEFCCEQVFPCEKRSRCLHRSLLKFDITIQNCIRGKLWSTWLQLFIVSFVWVRSVMWYNQSQFHCSTVEDSGSFFCNSLQWVDTVETHHCRSAFNHYRRMSCVLAFFSLWITWRTWSVFYQWNTCVQMNRFFNSCWISPKQTHCIVYGFVYFTACFCLSKMLTGPSGQTRETAVHDVH